MIYRHRHISTIIPALFRKVDFTYHERERFETHDHDFIDLDLIKQGSKKVAILLHGLEGSANRHYMLSQAKNLSALGYDVIAMNFRSCSGEMNKTLSIYSSGNHKDLGAVIEHKCQDYQEINLIGFSMGANILLKYLADTQTNQINKAVAISAPLDLAGCAGRLDQGLSKLYQYDFLKTLHQKASYLQKKYPDSPLKDLKIKKLKTFADFDHFVTAPLEGYESATDYWTKASSLPVLNQIRVPTLIVNAQNDPILSRDCFPSHEIVKNDMVKFKYPKFGGHVGFIQKRVNEPNLMDQWSANFLLNKTL